MESFEEWWYPFRHSTPGMGRHSTDEKLIAQAAWNEQQKKIDALEAKLAIAVEALILVSKLDPSINSDEGYNEWGEADCFNQSQTIANVALATINAKEKVG